MKKSIKFDLSKNSAKNFSAIENDITKLASEYGVSVSQVIEDFISDLRNFNNPNYIKKIEELDMSGDVSDRLLNSLIGYFNKVNKNYKRKENEAKKREKQRSDTQIMELKWVKIQENLENSVLDGKQGTEKEIIEELITNIKEGKYEGDLDTKEKKFILKKLKNRVNEINKMEAERKREEEARKKAKEAMQQIGKIVEREFNSGNVKSKVKYLISIRGAITGENRETEMALNIDGMAGEQLLQMIDERITTEKDEEYYEQVRVFTNDFKFLREYPETERALGGVKKVKFTDKESYDRYCSLRSRLQKGHDEHLRIDELLERDNVDKTDKRILNARKVVMDKEINKREAEGTR